MPQGPIPLEGSELSPARLGMRLAGQTCRRSTADHRQARKNKGWSSLCPWRLLMSFCLAPARGIRQDAFLRVSENRNTPLFVLGRDERNGWLCLGRHGAGLEYAAMRTPGLGRHREWSVNRLATAGAPLSRSVDVPNSE